MMTEIDLNQRHNDHRFELVVRHPDLDLVTHSYFHTSESVVRAQGFSGGPERATIRPLGHIPTKGECG